MMRFLKLGYPQVLGFWSTVPPGELWVLPWSRFDLHGSKGHWKAQSGCMTVDFIILDALSFREIPYLVTETREAIS